MLCWRSHLGRVDDGRPCRRHGPPSPGADAVAGGKAGDIAGFAVAADLRSTAWLVLLDYGYPAIVVVGVEIAGSLVLRLAMRPVAEGFVLRKPAAADEYWEFGALWNFVRNRAIISLRDMRREAERPARCIC